MTRRVGIRNFPQAPTSWDASSRAAWDGLIQAIETSDLFDKGRRSRPQFVIAGTVSAGVTLDPNQVNLPELADIVARLILALAPSNFIDVRDQT